MDANLKKKSPNFCVSVRGDTKNRKKYRREEISEKISKNHQNIGEY